MIDKLKFLVVLLRLISIIPFLASAVMFLLYPFNWSAFWLTVICVYAIELFFAIIILLIKVALKWVGID